MVSELLRANRLLTRISRKKLFLIQSQPFSRKVKSLVSAVKASPKRGLHSPQFSLLVGGRLRRFSFRIHRRINLRGMLFLPPRRFISHEVPTKHLIFPNVAGKIIFTQPTHNSIATFGNGLNIGLSNFGHTLRGHRA